MIKVIVNSIVIGIVNPMLLFLLLFFAILSSHFFPKRFCACTHKIADNFIEALIMLT